MNIFTLFAVELVKRPIFNVLVILLAAFDGNLGIAIIILTLIIRALLMKSTNAGVDMQKQMTDFQPKMQEIQEKHKDDPSKMSEETMKLFKQS